MLKVKPILQESIVELYTKSFPECITAVAMGCSSGPNSFPPICEIVEALAEICHRLNKKPPILHMFLNDLPGNDFNSISRSLPSVYKKLEDKKGDGFGTCFIAEVPGSFYGRLFPTNSLHFVHSSYSLHWCSEVPKDLFNEGNICIAKTSPPGVHKAYLDNFEKDLTEFLKLRSEEVIAGGHMVLTLYGRDADNDSSIEDRPSAWELFGVLLNDMGLIEEWKLDSFHLPFYGPSADEVRRIIQAQGSFKINHFETFHLEWDVGIDNCNKDSIDKYKISKLMAVVASFSGSVRLDATGNKL